MTRKLKTLGLALVAVFAMTAVVAANASAHYVFTSAAANTSLTGAQVGNHTFVTAGQTIQCTTAKFSGTQTGTEATAVPITPTYEGCTYAVGAKTADVTMNGCTYNFTGATTASGHGTVHVLCPVGKVIEVHLTNFNGAETCTLTIGAQIATNGYTAVNNGNHVDVTATANVKITPHGGGGCSLLITGKYSGVTTLEGFTDGKTHEAANKVKISVDS